MHGVRNKDDLLPSWIESTRKTLSEAIAETEREIGKHGEAAPTELLTIDAEMRRMHCEITDYGRWLLGDPDLEEPLQNPNSVRRISRRRCGGLPSQSGWRERNPYANQEGGPKPRVPGCEPTKPAGRRRRYGAQARGRGRRQHQREAQQRQGARGEVPGREPYATRVPTGRRQGRYASRDGAGVHTPPRARCRPACTQERGEHDTTSRPAGSAGGTHPHGGARRRDRQARRAAWRTRDEPSAHRHESRLRAAGHDGEHPWQVTEFSICNLSGHPPGRPRPRALARETLTRPASSAPRTVPIE